MKSNEIAYKLTINEIYYYNKNLFQNQNYKEGAHCVFLHGFKQLKGDTERVHVFPKFKECNDPGEFFEIPGNFPGIPWLVIVPFLQTLDICS